MNMLKNNLSLAPLIQKQFEPDPFDLSLTPLIGNMVINKNPHFDWLRQECLLIQSRRFHIFDPISDDDVCYTVDDSPINLVGDYPDFLKEFGWARFFTDAKDAPVVSVYPLKSYRRHQCQNGKRYVGFGYRSYQSVYFDEDALIRGEQSKVYSVSKKNGTEIYPSFSEWLFAAYSWAKSKYSAKQWEKIIDGPTPFSAEELSVVKARRQFKFRLLGFAEDGDALFEVENGSGRTLPFLTIGIRDIQQRILIGGVWLKVDHIEPGKTAVVKQNCYRDKIPQDQLEPFDCPDPIPEKKEAYWEFGLPF